MSIFKLLGTTLILCKRVFHYCLLKLMGNKIFNPHSERASGFVLF